MSGPEEVIARLVEATNRHDLDALVACFASDYKLETPAHPSRRFEGTAQVRRNWEQIFGGVPDIQTRTLRTAVDGDTIWTEWEMSGTRRDGAPYLMRGVIVFGIRGDQIAWGRFFLEPLDQEATTTDDAVRERVGSR